MNIEFIKAGTFVDALKTLELSPLSRILLAALFSMTVATGLFALYGALGAIDSSDGVTLPEWRAPKLGIVGLDPPKAATLDTETLMRPIFSKTRRPAPKGHASPSEKAAHVSPTTFSVKAIVQNKKTSQAFFVSPGASEGAWRRVGDTVDAWKITAIGPKEVVLQNGEQTTRANLYADPPPEGDVSAPPEIISKP